MLRGKVYFEKLLLNRHPGRNLFILKAEEKMETGSVNQVSLDSQSMMRLFGLFLCDSRLNCEQERQQKDQKNTIWL